MRLRSTVTMRPEGACAKDVTASASVVIAIVASCFIFISGSNLSFVASYCAGIISELVANAKLNFSCFASLLVRLNRVAIIQPERTHGQIESYAHTRVGLDVTQIYFVRIAPHVADIEKHRAAYTLHDGKRILGAVFFDVGDV